MRVTTLETVAGRNVEETLGYVRGTAIWSRRMLKNKTVGLRALEYMSLDDVAVGIARIRAEAEDKMLSAAASKGADTIIALRVELVDLGNETYQAIASGTAVRTAEIAAPVAEVPAFAGPASDMGVVVPFVPRRNLGGIARAI